MDKALKFVEGMSYKEFINDDKTVFAVVRGVEIIGETPTLEFKKEKIQKI